MKPVDRQKMCSNCDGRIPYEALQCPYCFTQQQMDSNNPSKNISPSSDLLSALYPPPYSSRSSETPDLRTAVKTAPLPETTDEEESTPAESISFGPILMLIVGSNLLTLGSLQFFFSEHGSLHLEMNASYWFLMVLIGAPLIYFGLKNLSAKN